MDKIEMSFKNEEQFLEAMYDVAKEAVVQEAASLETIEDLIDLLTELVNRKKEERSWRTRK